MDAKRGILVQAINEISKAQNPILRIFARAVENQDATFKAEKFIFFI